MSHFVEDVGEELVASLENTESRDWLVLMVFDHVIVDIGSYFLYAIWKILWRWFSQWSIDLYHVFPKAKAVPNEMAHRMIVP